MKDKQHLAELTQTILDPHSYPELLRDATLDLMDFFATCSGFPVPREIIESHQGTPTGSGLALSPNHAVRSMVDYYRTVQFIRGLHQAVEAALERFGAPVHVLYAGTGPYAPLALPLTTVFGADQVQFTLLDIHRESLGAVEKIVGRLCLDAYVKAYVEADAIAYQHPKDDPIHIVITETMQTGLEKETQVAITHNLVPQLCDEGFLIPEKISVHFALIDSARESQPSDGSETLPVQRGCTDLGAVYELSMTEGLAPNWFSNAEHAIQIPGATVQMPDHQFWPECNGLVFSTQIVIFQSLVMKDYESCLTMPRRLPGMRAIRPNDRILFYYEICDRPGMRYKVLKS